MKKPTNIIVIFHIGVFMYVEVSIDSCPDHFFPERMCKIVAEIILSSCSILPSTAVYGNQLSIIKSEARIVWPHF